MLILIAVKIGCFQPGNDSIQPLIKQDRLSITLLRPKKVKHRCSAMLAASDMTAPIEPPPPRTGRRWIFVVARWLITATVLGVTFWFMGLQIRSALAEMRMRPFTFRVEWVVVSVLFFALGMSVLSGSWYLVLQDRIKAIGLPIKLTLLDTVRSFLVSQIGKYVPGKALVLVLRYGLLAPKGAPFSLLAIASIFETFSTMASASMVGLVVLLLPFYPALRAALGEATWFLPMALLFTGAFMVSISPPVFSLLPRIFSFVIPAAKKHADDWIRWRTYLLSLIIGCVAWMLIGVSFWATVQAVSSEPLGWTTIPPLAAVFSLAFVAGFISMIPGQLGIREFMLIVVLKHVLGGDELVTVSATLLSRLITLLTEIVMSGGLLLTIRGPLATLASPGPRSDLAPLISADNGKIEHGT